MDRWLRTLGDGVEAGDPEACRQAALMIRQLPTDVAVIATALPVDISGVTIRNVGSHVVVDDGREQMRVTWADQFLVWDRGVVIGTYTGMDAAVDRAARQLAARAEYA